MFNRVDAILHLARFMRLVLTADGPVYVNEVAIQGSNHHRRVRNLHYTRAFAELPREEATSLVLGDR